MVRRGVHDGELDSMLVDQDRADGFGDGDVGRSTGMAWLTGAGGAGGSSLVVMTAEAGERTSDVDDDDSVGRREWGADGWSTLEGCADAGGAGVGDGLPMFLRLATPARR